MILIFGTPLIIFNGPGAGLWIYRCEQLPVQQGCVVPDSHPQAVHCEFEADVIFGGAFRQTHAGGHVFLCLLPEVDGVWTIEDVTTDLKQTFRAESTIQLNVLQTLAWGFALRTTIFDIIRHLALFFLFNTAEVWCWSRFVIQTDEFSKCWVTVSLQQKMTNCMKVITCVLVWFYLVTEDRILCDILLFTVLNIM